MTKTITIRLEEEVITKLKEIAKADLRSVGKTIEFLVREHLSREKSTESTKPVEKRKAPKLVDVFRD